ncbi:hypothetical protein BDQ94DRAFT_152455 [Aspergillus welwitschiae]|uniref:Secreted protein n=1 Tax=Aspergillus welwitschiae TaxID=1341132 RepID=A0A3F3PMX7_9EURO|nr:hypothetical protein BDQ94DRAFT_152455 [Aspergillus welwitschiae]RDH28277.1 hypothetical protein BDQ94DRAFT_152455 [Aspergillus welwitschiae]
MTTMDRIKVCRSLLLAVSLGLCQNRMSHLAPSMVVSYEATRSTSCIMSTFLLDEGGSNVRMCCEFLSADRTFC